jgi:hypothetical protein
MRRLTAARFYGRARRRAGLSDPCSRDSDRARPRRRGAKLARRAEELEETLEAEPTAVTVPVERVRAERLCGRPLQLGHRQPATPVGEDVQDLVAEDEAVGFVGMVVVVGRVRHAAHRSTRPSTARDDGRHPGDRFRVNGQGGRKSPLRQEVDRERPEPVAPLVVLRRDAREARLRVGVRGRPERGNPPVSRREPARCPGA